MNTEEKMSLKEKLYTSLKKGTVTLSDGREIEIRQLCAKEIKIIANATNSMDMMVEVLKSVVQDKIDVISLPLHDIDTIFLAIHRVAKNEIPLAFRCGNSIDGVVCDNLVETTLMLDQVKLSPQQERIIPINKNLTIAMRYPTLYEAEHFKLDNPTDVFDLILRCIEYVNFFGETLVIGTDCTEEDVIEIMDFLDENGMLKLISFLQNAPTNTVGLAVCCDKCGHKEPILLSGINQIMGWDANSLQMDTANE